MENLVSLPIFGIILTILCYFIGFSVRKLINSPLTNPMLVANVLVVLIICVTPLTLEQYMKGGSIITMFIVPATTILSLRIYRQRKLLKENLIPILLGCLAGSLSSLGVIALLCRLFSIDKTVTISLLPKSVTTAIAMELSVKHQGLGGLTVSAVIITGIFAAAFNPFFARSLKLKDPVAAGVAMGASGHAIGTAAALEMGEVQGAMSGIAIGIMGIITSLLFIFI
ncbi:LrgB family protein [Treponema primitia ZAS-2]|uniref:LrgB family protein n=1 Tax=Treponema primitia (strain ATCC BAA-887 / DSM 12427 / ZAS-2) TaxID=545694 RepID=F5YKX6_TREPZ|nr:LrgB family protein [Treponema primitia]AEF83991.1 LrgB family protein [Treponema primitia ZAS-2]